MMSFGCALATRCATGLLRSCCAGTRSQARDALASRQTLAGAAANADAWSAHGEAWYTTSTLAIVMVGGGGTLAATCVSEPANCGTTARTSMCRRSLRSEEGRGCCGGGSDGGPGACA